MNKQEFLTQLRQGLSGLPQNDIEERLTFYSEMIDDRMEEGLSEEEAVEGVGSVNSIISQIIAEVPLAKIVKEKITPKKKLKVWEIVLLILGSPIWLSLMIAAFAVALSLYAALWSVIIALWAVFAAFVVSAFGCILEGVVFAFCGNVLSGVALIAIGFVCAGLSVLLYFASIAATKGTVKLTKKIVLWTKNYFVKKEEK